MAKLTTQERLRRMYEHRDADRVPIMDSPWSETIERWVGEGMPTKDYISHFDLDKTAYISTDNSPRLPEEIISEDDEHIIRTTRWGATTRTYKNLTTTPEHLGFSITTPEDWEKIKPRMAPSDDRIPWDMLKKNYKTWREEGRWITGGLWFGFDITHSYMVGTETMLMAMLEEPEWVEDMFNHQLDVSIAMLERIWDAGYTFDEVHWYDDMGYKEAQFFSMRVYRELLKPVHKRAIDWAHAHGCVARLHSCGQITPFVPELVEIGLDGLNPLEIKAGVDPAALKAQYGDKLLFHGGINAVHWDKPEIITAEIERVVPIMKENGGYIFASDHSIPPHVSLADFTRIIETLKRVGSY
ncbi:MAG: uroporphyrinogen decarboxylase family protein [Christensenellales bacterium]|jgi:uroporphyrinogen decarboxylase